MGSAQFNIKNLFTQVILPDLSNPNCPHFIRGRSLWTCSELTELIGKDDEIAY